MKKYMLHPGPVASKTDGDEHFIDAPTLARLYGVDMSDCLVLNNREPNFIRTRESGRKDVIHLYPRYSGNYDRRQQSGT